MLRPDFFFLNTCGEVSSHGLSARLLVRTLIRLSVFWFVRLSVSSSVRSFISPCVSPYVRPSISSFVRLFVRSFVRPSSRLLHRTSVRPSVLTYTWVPLPFRSCKPPTVCPAFPAFTLMSPHLPLLSSIHSQACPPSLLPSLRSSFQSVSLSIYLGHLSVYSFVRSP